MAVNSLSMTNRITGMYSGFDTDSIVKSLLKIEQLKVDKQNRSLTTLQWKQEAYTGVNTDLKAFMNDYVSVLGGNTMMKSSNYVSYKTTVSGGSETAVSVTANADASAGSVKINSISQLASAAMAKSSGKVSSKGTEISETNSTKLKDLDLKNKLQFVNGEIHFAINGEGFIFKDTDSLQTVLNTVNSSDAGVTMSYSRLTDSFSVTAKEEGLEGMVTIKNMQGNAFGADSAFGIATGTYQNGQNAMLNINGVDVERGSNTFVIDGIGYTLNETYNVEKDSTVSPITIKLEQDSSVALDTIKKFVEGYNTMVSKLTDLTITRKTRDQRGYTALTEEEKESMTEEQIEQWETIAKTGLLYNDAGISNLLSGLRGALYDTIEGVGLSPADIGIRTGDYTKRGQLELDETRLKAALEKNPHQVMNVFMNISASDDKATAYKENGLMYRINNLMDSYMKGSGQTSLNSLQTSIQNTSTKISDMEDRMDDLAERYYKKYAALEEAMSKMDSQSSWLSSMMGSLS